MSRFIQLASLAALLASSAPLTAQAPLQSRTSGFTAGASVNGSSLSGWGESSPDAGGGFGVRAGYGLSRLQLFAALDFGVMAGGKLGTDYGIGHGEAGARYSFRSDSRALRPYVQATVLRLVTLEGEDTDEMTSSGAGYSAGAGVEYFLRRSIAVDLGVSRTRGSITVTENHAGARGDLDAGYATTRVTLGLNWHP